MSAENPFSKQPQPREMTAADLGIPEQPIEEAPAALVAERVEAPAENERIREISKQIESLSATGGRSAERLRRLTNEAGRNPEYFGDNQKLSENFWSRVREKAKDLHNGPELMRKKAEFWDKWKQGSMITSAGGVMAGVAGAAWTAKYGFDHTYLKEMFDMSVNVPMVAGFATAALAEGSMGIAKLMEVLRGGKAEKLWWNLRSNNI